MKKNALHFTRREKKAIFDTVMKWNGESELHPNNWPTGSYFNCPLCVLVGRTVDNDTEKNCEKCPGFRAFGEPCDRRGDPGVFDEAVFYNELGFADFVNPDNSSVLLTALLLAEIAGVDVVKRWENKEG
jgi:hypothetical protein